MNSMIASIPASVRSSGTSTASNATNASCTARDVTGDAAHQVATAVAVVEAE